MSYSDPLGRKHIRESKEAHRAAQSALSTQVQINPTTGVFRKVFASRAEWLAARRHGIGASEVSAILGLNPYRSCFEVWAGKVATSGELEAGRVVGQEADSTEAATWGVLLEPVVRTEVARRIGRRIFIPGKESPDQHVSWFNTRLLERGIPLFVTPDGQIDSAYIPEMDDVATHARGLSEMPPCPHTFDGILNSQGAPVGRQQCLRPLGHATHENLPRNGHRFDLIDPRGPGLYEGKASGLFVDPGAWAAEGPTAHIIQVQAGLAVLDWSWGLLAGLIGGQTLVLHEHERDNDFIAWMLDELAKFWKLVESKTPPTPDDSLATAKALTAYYNHGVPGLTQELPAIARTWLKERREAKEQAKDAERRVTAVENQIKAAMGEAAVGFIPAPEQWDTAQGPRPDVEGFYWPTINVKAQLCEHCDAPVRQASEHRRMSELPKKIKGTL